MTNSDILNYFIHNVVYQFDGSLAQFQALQAEVGASYNYIIVNGSIYFTSDIVIQDLRVSILTQEQ
jgi:hypothetical protein